MQTMNNKYGFTLIELLIVVAIIGILASIALPAYQTYTKRAHIAEGLNLANDMKIAVTEYYSTFGKYPEDNNSVGAPDKDQIKGNAVKSIELNLNKIIITYNEKVQLGSTIIMEGTLTEDATVVWSCTQGTVPLAYRPNSCRPD